MSQPESQTDRLGLPLHTMTIRLLEIVLDDEVRTFDLSEFQPLLRTAQYRPPPGVPEVWELVLDRCRGLRKCVIFHFCQEYLSIQRLMFFISITY